MTVLSHVPVGFPAIAYSPRLPLWYPQLHEALCSHLGFLPLFSEVLPGVLSTRAMPVPQSSRQFRRSLVGFDPLVDSVQVLPAQDPFKQIRTAVPFLPNCQHSVLPHTLRFCTISLWAARIFAVFPFIMLTSFCNLLGTNDCSAIPSFFPVL